MDKAAIRELFSRVSSWKRRSERAPHKPLLLLLAIADCLRRNDRLVPFLDVDRRLRPLLSEFGPPRQSNHPEYPFWRLQRDGIWEVISDKPLESRAGNTDPKKSELVKHHAKGGLKEEVYITLQREPKFAGEIASSLLEKNFPQSLHEDIRQAIGLPNARTWDRNNTRDPAFRGDVIRAYQHRCVVCGYSLRLENGDIGIEAAHIQWHQANGPDIISNGLCLCVLHHRMFDRGAIGFTDEEAPRLIVSEHLHGAVGLEETALRFSGKQIAEPLRPSYKPRNEFIRWHQREVFRAPCIPIPNFSGASLTNTARKSPVA